jgi:antitoxin MazE
LRLELTRIGNSRGIRIPKPLIEQCRLGDVVEARVTSEGLVLAPGRKPREDWRQVFLKSRWEPDEPLLDQATPNEFDSAEWKW